MRKLEELGLPKLNEAQIQHLCEEAEKAAWKYLLSRVSKNLISDVDITVEVEGEAPITVTVEVAVSLSSLSRGVDEEELAREASRAALQRIEELLRGYACRSGK